MDRSVIKKFETSLLSILVLHAQWTLMSKASRLRYWLALIPLRFLSSIFTITWKKIWICSVPIEHFSYQNSITYKHIGIVLAISIFCGVGKLLLTNVLVKSLYTVEHRIIVPCTIVSFQTFNSPASSFSILQINCFLRNELKFCI